MAAMYDLDHYVGDWDKNPPALYGTATRYNGRDEYGDPIEDEDRPARSLQRECWRKGNDIPVAVFMLGSLQKDLRWKDYKRDEEIEDWLYDNCENWAKWHHQIALYSEEDVLLFRLAWDK